MDEGRRFQKASFQGTQVNRTGSRALWGQDGPHLLPLACVVVIKTTPLGQVL